jgi:hypothetical protein
MVTLCITRFNSKKIGVLPIDAVECSVWLSKQYQLHSYKILSDWLFWAKSDSQIRLIFPSVLPHGATRLLQDGFL